MLLFRPRSGFPQHGRASVCLSSGAWPAPRPVQAWELSGGAGPAAPRERPSLPAGPGRRKAPGKGGGRPGLREAGAGTGAAEEPAPPQPRLQPGLSPQALARPPYPAGRGGGGPQAPLGAAIVSLLPRWAPPSCAHPVQRGRRHLVPSPCGVSAMAGLLCRLLLCLAAAGAAADLLLEEARRSVDLSTHLAKVSAELSLANAAGGTAASAFLLALEPGLEPRLAYLGVQVSAGREGQRGTAPRSSGGGGRTAARPRALPGPRRPQGHVGTAPRSRLPPPRGRCRLLPSARAPPAAGVAAGERLPRPVTRVPPGAGRPAAPAAL